MSAEVVTCSKTIALHSLESRQPLNSYTYHRGIVNSVTVNHTNKAIASCGQDGKLFVVSAEKPQNKLIEHNFYPNPKEKPASLSACAFSPNSKYLAVGSVDSVIKLWDLRNDKNSPKELSIAQIKSHICSVTSLAWIKNIKNEQFGTNVLASASTNGDIYLHSNRTGTFTESLALKLNEGVNCIRASQGPDYCRLAACTNAGTLAVWDLLSGKDKPLWQTASPKETRASMTCLSISTYSPILLVTSSLDETLVFFDIHEKKSVKTITAEEPLSCVGLHGNAHTLVAGGAYGGCFVYDLRNPTKPLNKLAGHETAIKQLEFFRREKESNSVVSDSKSNKAPSVVNSNSAITPPSLPEQKSTIVATGSDLQKKSKQNIKAPEVKLNTFVNTSTTSIPKRESTTQDSNRDIKLESRLSSTAQELIKNSVPQPKQPEPSLPRFGQTAQRFGQTAQRFGQSSGSDGFRSRAMRQVRNDPSQSQSRELRQVKQRLGEVVRSVKQLRNEMYDMQQRQNLSIIRQFQLHQTEMREMLEGLLARDREKDDLIRRLEAENQRLRHSSF